jgi:anaerobic magnesium-protoporphyrin IX monomethyl ester cyclase
MEGILAALQSRGNMNTVLFANSYFYRLDKKQWKFKQPYPPLATILAAAVLRSQRFEVSLFDSNLRYSPQEIRPFLERSPRFFVLYDDGFNYLSKMCLSDMREAAFALIGEAKKRNAVVVVSSSDATDHVEKYIDAGADFIIRGEAEETLSELMILLRGNHEIAGITGLAYRSNGKLIVTPPRSVKRNLDELPLPAWDLINIQEYRDIWVRHHGYFSLNLATTRGCPYKCNWCAKPIYGNRYNSRSPQNVVTEIEFLLREHKPDHFWMCDDIFALKPGWIQEFNDIIQTRKLKFKYKIQSRVDLLLESDTIKALAESGAETVWVGAESGSQKILDAMDKGTTIPQIYKAAKLLKENNVRVAFFLQLGYLGETKQDIDRTIRMLLDIMPDEAGISVSYPLPGTKFYDKVKDQLTEKQNWTNSDDLAMMFQSTFNSQYYKHLHRYVHSLYRRKKALGSLKALVSRPLTVSKSDVKSFAGLIYFSAKALMLKRKLDASWKENLVEQPAELVM